MANFYSFSNKVKRHPKFKESVANDIVRYGHNNLYDQYLFELMRTSSKHNAILNRKTNLVAGQGWVNDNDFVKNVWGDEDLNDIVYKCAYDLNIANWFALFVTWSNDGSEIARIQFCPFHKLRKSADLDKTQYKEDSKLQEDGLDYWWFSNDWSNPRKKDNIPQLFPSYSDKYNKKFTQVYVAIKYVPGVDHYTLPEYIATIDWIETDSRVANFHLSSLQNGYFPGLMVSLNNGVPDQDAQESIKEQLDAMFQGDGNANKVFLTFSDGAENVPVVLPINSNDSDEKFLQLENHIKENLAMGHNIPMQVLGAAVSGKLGNSSEIVESEAIFQSQVIDGKQKFIERHFNILYNNPNEKLILKKVRTINKVKDDESDINN